MTPRAVSLGAPFLWFLRAFDIGRRDPRPLFGALAILVACMTVVGVLQLSLQFALAGSPALMTTIYLVLTLLAWVLLPALYGGVFRIVDATDRGRPVRAGDVLAPLRDPPLARKLVLTSLAFALIYLVLGAGLMLTPAGSFLADYLALMQSVPPGGRVDNAALQALFESMPAGTLPAMALFCFALCLWVHASMFAQAVAALSPAGVRDSIVAGLLATARNLLPLLAASLVIGLLGFVAMLVGLLGLVLLTMLSPTLAGLLALPAMLLLTVIAYALVFGFYYNGWREIFADAAPTSDSDVIAA